jgi:glucosamine--fructose-6-phosphate aminotransferase (isomerizing)
VLINLIEEVQRDGLKLGKAVQVALNQVVGAYAIAVFDKKNPNEIVAKIRSPLAIGVGEGEFFIASDASPLSTRQMRSTLKMVKWQI